MKRLLLSSALAFTLTGAALAQTAQQAPPPDGARHGHGMHHQANPHKMAEHLSRKLNLSADQTAKIEPILADREQKIAALRQNPQLSEEDRRAQFHAIGKATHEQIASLLTPEQREQMKAMHHGHHHGQQPEAPPSAS